MRKLRRAGKSLFVRGQSGPNIRNAPTFSAVTNPTIRPFLFTANVEQEPFCNPSKAN